MKRTLLLLASVTVLIAVSCYYDNEEALYPSLDFSCDTSIVTFSGTIFPILDNSCLGCHSNSTAFNNGNIRLENYADVKANAVAVKGSINYTGTYSHMPKYGSQLKACSLAKFDIWISQGMPDN